jgi:hypothetical protein
MTTIGKPAGASIFDLLPLLPTASTSFRVNPFAYIGWAIFQPDVLHLASRQELYGIAVNKRQVLQVENENLIECLQTKEPLQLSNVLRFDSATQVKNNRLT